MELVMVFGLATVLVGMTMYSLKPGKAKTSTIGLAAALSDEFRAARQLAISNGHPVAIGLPVTGGEVADSLYRLEGWNVPLVTWSVGYSGDYPGLGFAAASWSPSAGTFSTASNLPPLSKFGAFDFDAWVPSAHQNDSIICFTPDGGVVTNDLPALDGRFTVVVANNPQVSGRTITAGREATTIYISSNGAVDYSKGTPGATLGDSTVTARASAKSRQVLNGSASIYLSEIMIRPATATSGADALCTPGQQISFELYAYDPEGRELFTQWTQNSPSGKLGSFGFPKSNAGPLQSEVERMEYIDNPPNAQINWNGAPDPPGGCFRSRWTWTVPIDSQPGERYNVEADVQDATGQATIANPAPAKSFVGPPEGRLLAEVWNGTKWELVRMNPDGSGRQVITPPGVEEVMPTVDRGATKMAYLQGPPGDVNARRVKVRSLNGGGEFSITPTAGRYTSVSLSPDGGWISYRLDDAGAPGVGELFIQKLDETQASAFRTPQAWVGSVLDVEPSRTGWSYNSDFALWGNGNTLRGASLNYTTGVQPVAAPLLTYNVNNEQIYAPTCFRPGGAAAPERVMFTIGNFNPVLAHIAFTPGSSQTGSFNNGHCVLVDLNAGGSGAGSGNFDDNFASISADGTQLILPRIDRPAGDLRSALIALWNGTTFESNPASAIVLSENVRSVVWLP